LLVLFSLVLFCFVKAPRAREREGERKEIEHGCRQIETKNGGFELSRQISNFDES